MSVISVQAWVKAQQEVSSRALDTAVLSLALVIFSVHQYNRHIAVHRRTSKPLKKARESRPPFSSHWTLGP